MSLKIKPTKIVDYSNSIGDSTKAKQLHSFYLARPFCHLAVLIDCHNLIYHCHCFFCRICRILLTSLFSRGYQKLLLIIRKKNCLSIIYDFVNGFPVLQRFNWFCLWKFKDAWTFFNLLREFMHCQIVKRMNAT